MSRWRGSSSPHGFIQGLEKIWITACGTAYHAGLVGKEIFERKLRIPVDVVYAHELRYRDPIIGPNSLTIAISQSGETADTLAAAQLAKDRGSRLLAITNVVGSTLSRISDDVLYTRAGPEIAVASTKAYLAMLIGEYLLTVGMGRERGRYTDAESAEMIAGLRHLPLAAEEVLARADDIAETAKRFEGAEDVYFLGRGVDYAVAMEGSLKMKEISYIHSEAMPAGELKHGTLALVTEGTPVITVLTQGDVYDKTVSALMEVKARGAYTIAVAYDDDADAAKHADEVIRIPRVPDSLSPVLAAIPLQLLAYYVAEAPGPRHRSAAEPCQERHGRIAMRIVGLGVDLAEIERVGAGTWPSTRASPSAASRTTNGSTPSATPSRSGAWRPASPARKR